MEVRVPRCVGLDVHKANVVACMRIVDGKVRHETRTFSTMTCGLLELATWLQENEITQGVMEATGVYWKPVWHILEEHIDLVLANAAHVRNVPGRKSDVKDAQWLSDLLAHGLVASSFVPPEPIMELRDLTRTRRQLGREVTQHKQRVQKVLEDCNVKLANVLSDVFGQSGRSIIEEIIRGETNPERLASLGSLRLKCSRSDLIESLRGRITSHHRFMLKMHLSIVDSLLQSVEEIESQIEVVLCPFRSKFELLKTIPGVSDTAAAAILGEVGVDMSRFPNARHFVSWAGLCPKMDESAGKHRSRRIRKGAPWLKSMLIQCAWGAARAKGTYLKAQFQRIRSRRGPKKAAVAVAASILTAIYFILRDEVPYHDLGPDHFNMIDKERTAHRLAKRIRSLGYEVKIDLAA